MLAFQLSGWSWSSVQPTNSSTSKMKEPTKQLEIDCPTLFGKHVQPERRTLRQALRLKHQAARCPGQPITVIISLRRATLNSIRERSLHRNQRLLGTRSNPAAGETERITKLCSILQLWKTQLEHSRTTSLDRPHEIAEQLENKFGNNN